MNVHFSHGGSLQDGSVGPQQPIGGADARNRRDVTPTTFAQTNLISDGSAAAGPAVATDPNLINPWGVAYGPTGPFWINENGSGFSSIDSVNGNNVTLNAIPPVTIAPPDPSVLTASPTGIVFNSFSQSGAFTLPGPDGKPANFLFATEDGTISGWAGGTQSTIVVNEANNPADGSEALDAGAVYKGLAIAETKNGPMLYAANFRHGTVDVYNQNFNEVMSFTDKHLPAGYAPFNVQVLDDKLFVTFALQDDAKHDDVAGLGNGFVDEFDLQGHLLQRVASGGSLDSPWGLAIAPSSFGTFAGDLLVGNFGNGTISAFDLQDHDKFAGELTNSNGIPIVIPDLWELIPGNNGSAGSSSTLYFTSGVQNESDGLFGSITANSMPMSSMTVGSHQMSG
jgi:uncharacterized protein (TIGR03118 family)